MFSIFSRIFGKATHTWNWAVFCLSSGSCYTIRHRKTLPPRRPCFYGSLAEFHDLEEALDYLENTLHVPLGAIYVITPEREYRADKLTVGSNRKI